MADTPKKLDKVIAQANKPQVLAQGGFLTLVRRKARNRFDDNSMGPWYDVETVKPRFFDAVVLLLVHRRPGQDPLVALRRGARPSLCLRADDPRWQGLDQGRDWDKGLWELPAGGVEPEDLLPGGAGLEGRASLEAWEEAGVKVPPGDFRRLGPAPVQAPAYCPERLHYLAASIDVAQARPPRGDGHPMEEGSYVEFVPLAEAMRWCREGVILDSKTELGLHRLAAAEAEGLSAGNKLKYP